MEVYSDEWIAYIGRLEKERNGSATTIVVSDTVSRSNQIAAVKRLFLAEIDQLRSMQEQRDKIMFNAGRFVAGARDDVAVSAHRLFEALLEG